MTSTPFAAAPPLTSSPEAAAAPALCATCQHPLSAHDSTSQRWCAVTENGVGTRSCICQGMESTRPAARHY